MSNILVSGASGIVGYGILKSLKSANKNLTLIGTTIYEDSVAQGFCDIFEKAILTNDSNYITWLTDTIKKHNIAFIIPGIEADLYKWVEHISEIESSGAKILLNNIDLIKFTKDKWIFYEQLQKHNISTAIPTSLENDYEQLVEKFGANLLLKPRIGFGSKGIVKVNNKETFLTHQSKIGTDLMVQPFIGTDNEEYSASAFCDGKGGMCAYMSIRRKLSNDGFTEKAEVVEMGSIKKAILELCAIFKPVGPTNFQFRNHYGELKLLEINPRISSATSIRTAFGYNESLMAVEYYLENKLPLQPLIRKGKAVRYTEDFIFYENSNHI